MVDNKEMSTRVGHIFTFKTKLDQLCLLCSEDTKVGSHTEELVGSRFYLGHLDKKEKLANTLKHWVFLVVFVKTTLTLTSSWFILSLLKTILPCGSIFNLNSGSFLLFVRGTSALSRRSAFRFHMFMGKEEQYLQFSHFNNY